MRDYRDAKAMAQALRDNLKSKNIALSVAESLELVAKQFGIDNWNILAAKVTDTGTRPKASEGVEFFATIPVIRMFDVGKAKEFYVDFLGFTIDWEGHIREGGPLYMQLSRDGLTLHLSEHHGDAAPGGTIELASRAGGGARAQIRLPLARSGAAERNSDISSAA